MLDCTGGSTSVERRVSMVGSAPSRPVNEPIAPVNEPITPVKVWVGDPKSLAEEAETR